MPAECSECGHAIRLTTWNRRFCGVSCRKRYHAKLERERDQVRRAGGEIPIQGKPREYHGEELEAIVREAERIEAERRGVKPPEDPNSAAAVINELFGPKKEDKK